MEKLIENLFELLENNFEIVWILFLFIIPFVSSLLKKKKVVGEGEHIDKMKSKRSQAPLKDSLNSEEYFYNNKKIG